MSLPDLRQTMAVSVCSWLAMNAVRMRDEAVAKAKTALSSSSPPTPQQPLPLPEDAFDYVLPWWCRGGASSVVRDTLRAVGKDAPPPPPTMNNNDFATQPVLGSENSVSARVRLGEYSAGKSATLSKEGNGEAGRRKRTPRREGGYDRRRALHSAVESPTYYTLRGIPTRFGFYEPLCPPLTSNVVVAPPSVGHMAASSSSPSSSAVSVTLTAKTLRSSDLPILQSACAKGVTYGTHGLIAYRPRPRRAKGTVPEPSAAGRRATVAARSRVWGETLALAGAAGQPPHRRWCGASFCACCLIGCATPTKRTTKTHSNNNSRYFTQESTGCPRAPCVGSVAGRGD